MCVYMWCELFYLGIKDRPELLVGAGAARKILCVVIRTKTIKTAGGIGVRLNNCQPTGQAPMFAGVERSLPSRTQTPMKRPAISSGRLVPSPLERIFPKFVQIGADLQQIGLRLRQIGFRFLQIGLQELFGLGRLGKIQVACGGAGLHHDGRGLAQTGGRSQQRSRGSGQGPSHWASGFVQRRPWL